MSFKDTDVIFEGVCFGFLIQTNYDKKTTETKEVRE